MSARCLNIPCQGCTYADQYGRDCKFGLMFPIALLIAGVDRCPNRKDKTIEQVEQQTKYK